MAPCSGPGGDHSLRLARTDPELSKKYVQKIPGIRTADTRSVSRALSNLGMAPYRWTPAAALIGFSGAGLIAVLASAASPTIALVGLVALAGGIGILVSPRFGLLLLAFSLPFERIGRLTNDADPVAISASRLIGVAALGAFLLHALLKRQNLHFGWPFWLFSGFTAIAFLTNGWTATPEDTFRDSVRILANLLFFFYAINAIRDYRTARHVVVAWMLGSMLAGAYSLGDYYVFQSTALSETEVGLTSERVSGTVVSDSAEARVLGMNVRRLFGTTAHPAIFGLNNLMVLPFFIWAIRTQRRRWRALWIPGLVISLMCVLLSNTRACLLILLLVGGYALMRRLIPATATVGLAGLVAAIAIVSLIPEDVYVRTLDPSLYTTSGADGVRARFTLLSASVELIEGSFLTGIGVGDQTTLVEMITNENTGFLSTVGLRGSAHNEYLWILVEAGIFGFLFFYGFVWMVTSANFKLAARLRNTRGPDTREQYLFVLAAQCVIVAVLIFALQSLPFHYPLKGWWLAIAISYVMWENLRSTEQGSRTPA